MELEGLGVAGQLGLEGLAGGGRAAGVGGGKAGVGWRCRGGCSWGWRGVIAQGGGGLGCCHEPLQMESSASEPSYWVWRKRIE